MAHSTDLLIAALSKDIDADLYKGSSVTSDKMKAEAKPKKLEAKREEPEKGERQAPPPEPKREVAKPDLQSFVRDMQQRKLSEVASKVQSSLDARFKRKQS